MLPSSPTGGTLYFAYAANLSRAHMALWCPEAVPVVRAVLPDFRLVFRSWADVIPSPGDYVQGALYEIDAKGLAALDEFEDCPSLCRRIHIRVLSQQWSFDAMTYQMKPGPRIALPDRAYLDLILQGYADWRLDRNLLTVLDRGNDDPIQ